MLKWKLFFIQTYGFLPILLFAAKVLTVELAKTWVTLGKNRLLKWKLIAPELKSSVEKSYQKS